MNFKGKSEVKFFHGRTHSKIEWAINVAVQAHRGQKRKDGEPYILHPFRVMFAALNALRGQADYERRAEIVTCAAVLHDVCEDCGVPLTLIADQVGEEIALVVERLTRRKGEVYSEYVARAAENELSRIIKIADVEDNLGGIDRVPDQSEREGLRRRYTWALSVLK